MNAPEAGTVKEYLVNEEDTVTVGQDILKLELGGPPKGGEKQAGGQDPKQPAPDDQSTSSANQIKDLLNLHLPHQRRNQSRSKTRQSRVHHLEKNPPL